MKAAAKKELRSKTIEELIKDLRDGRAEVAKMMIEMATGKLANLNSIKNKKKDIARILTYIGEKKEEAKESKTVNS